MTTRYDVAEHLRTPEEMAAYLEVCLEEAEGNASFIAKALSCIRLSELVLLDVEAKVAHQIRPHLEYGG